MFDEQTYLPFTTGQLPQGAWLVIAPHPDDEAFGLGGTLLLAAQQGISADVLFLTSGDKGGAEGIAAVREQEALEAARLMGIREVLFWHLPDRSLSAYQSVIGRLAEVIGSTKPGTIFFPSPVEPHPDHRAASVIAWEALRKAGFTAEPWSYEISVQGPVNHLLDISQVAARKREIMAVYASQMTQNNYVDRIMGLNQGRAFSLPLEVSHAEAFYIWQKRDRPMNAMLLELQTRKLGMDALPEIAATVSVIIRTKNRPHFLREAIVSVATQTYRDIELVVVNDGGEDVEELVREYSTGSIRHVVYEALQPGRGRAAAANAGLDLATGKYLNFLDDDDLFYPEHIAVLVDALHGQNKAHCAYSGVHVEHYKEGILGTSDLLNWPFHWQRIWGRNYLPIHSVLFEKSLLNYGCRFDESLEIYEDWDFWVQVTQHTGFIHIDRVTACYRNYGSSGCGLEQDENFILKAKGIYFDKWKAIWSGEQINELIDHRESLLEHSEYLANSLKKQICEYQAECDGYKREIAGQKQEIEEQKLEIAGQKQEIEEQKLEIAGQKQEIEEQKLEIAGQKQEIEEQKLEIAGQKQEIEEQNQEIAGYKKEINALYRSRSWKLTSPYRWLGWQLRRVLHVLALGLCFVRERGDGWRGWRSLVFKILEKLREQGPQGVLYGVRMYALRRQLSSEMSSPVVVEITRPKLLPHTVAVDIIICVHNALEDVQKCLESVVRHTFPPYELILVDDGSDTETCDYLNHFAKAKNTRLIRNEVAYGYTLAANQGIRASLSPYVVLLNSDTVVNPDWLDRMVACAESDPSLGMVGPLSNTASWQSIPDIEKNGDWPDNPLPANMTVDDMARQVAIYSGQLYPRIPFLNGFCLLIKRACINEVGEFDEENFAHGYGEENDYCLRTRQAGWSLAVADDVYIYHAQSKSYTTERRLQLCERASQVLARKHGQSSIDEGVYFCRYDRVLEGVRARAKWLFERRALVEEAKARWGGKRVIFILPSGDAGGGANVVISEAKALIRMSIDACLLNFADLKIAFEKSYPKLGIPVIYAPDKDSIPELCMGFDAIIATHNASVAWLAPLSNIAKSGLTLGYYIQDFEPYFYDEGDDGYKQALASYTLLPDVVRVTKTDWNRREVFEKTGVNCTVLGVNVDIDLFRPRHRREISWPVGPLRIAAMIRLSSPRRSPRLTMEVLKVIEQKYGKQIEILLFGEESRAPGFLALPQDFAWKNMGKQTSEEMALLLNEVDIFVDFSEYQAMGLTAMEAMACGAAVIVPENGGASSFASHEKNALFVDTEDPEACGRALDRLVSDNDLRMRLQKQALSDITQCFSEAPAFNMLKALFGY